MTIQGNIMKNVCYAFVNRLQVYFFRANAHWNEMKTPMNRLNECAIDRDRKRHRHINTHIHRDYSIFVCIYMRTEYNEKEMKN